jgi:SecD/SecF fusion protein
MQALLVTLQVAAGLSFLYMLAGLALPNKFHFKFGLIGTMLFLGTALILPPKERLKLGIDLSGGTILVYQVKDDGRAQSSRMDDLIAALKERVNPEGLSDIPIRKVGNNRIEIILAQATPEEVDLLKRKMTDVGSLEFRILANERKDGPRGTNAISRAMAPSGLAKPPKGYRWAKLGEIITGNNPKIDGTKLDDLNQNLTRDRYAGTEVILTGKDSLGKETFDSVSIVSNTRNSLTLKRAPKMATVSTYRLEYNPSKIVPGKDAIVREQPGPNGRVDTFILYVEDRQNVTGELLAHAYPTQDERIQPAVGFQFNAQGARKFGTLTSTHLPEEGGAFKYRLAVLLDGQIMSAPSINSEIRDSGIIEGVQPKEVSYLIQILRSGSLPASIDPTPLLEENIGPTLGRDTIEKGLRAIFIAMLVVPIFMIIYYRFAGVVAVFALVLNMILLVAFMAVTQSAFTLPGLAGLALTIGMAVDANVLIFERIREEAERGASVSAQVRNGFARAWTTILDSNLTTVLSGLVLFAIGSEEIKGFALTLIVGLVWNLFTAVFVSRVIFDFFLSRKWLTRFRMMKLFGRTNIDFVRPRKILMTCSAVVILIGLGIFVSRGSSIYNIDFTGGTLVTIQLDDKRPEIASKGEVERAAFVRSTASDVLPGATIETINVGSEARGTRFTIRTTDEDVKDVQAKILKAFEGSLARLETTIGKPTAIPAAKPPKADEKTAEETTPAPAADVDRFAGGRSYPLHFNRTVEPATIQSTLVLALDRLKVTNPETRFEVVVPSTANTQTTQDLTVRTNLEPATAEKTFESMTASLRSNPALLFERLENFGGAVAGETRMRAMFAIFVSWLAIIAYVWVRFKSVSYGLAAVLALVHDVLFTMGAVAVSPYKIDLPMIAAFLTLIGFSVNDTIVIFDRLREIKGKTPYLTSQMINDAVNQTLSRTILTSLTAWLVVVILYLFGGEGLEGFSFCLVVGFLSGTYSTIYIASTLLVDWEGKGAPAAVKSEPVMATTREV